MKIRNDTRTIVISTLSNGLAILSLSKLKRWEQLEKDKSLADCLVEVQTPKGTEPLLEELGWLLSTDYVARFRFVSASNRLEVAEEDFAFVQSAFVQSRLLGVIHGSKEM
jgi:hypothetical protein